MKTIVNVDGTTIISAKIGAVSLDLAPVEELHNTAIVTLEAGRIDVTYIDNNGKISYDVMAEDTSGNYGCLLADGPRDQAQQDPKLIEAYLGADLEDA